MRGCGGLVLLILVIFTVVKYAVWIGLTVGIFVALVVLWKFIEWLDRRREHRDRRRDAIRIELAAIAARADDQNAQILAGDEHGVYGNYPPVGFDIEKGAINAQAAGGRCERPPA